MKTRLTLLSVLLLAAVSCENDSDGTVWDDPNFVRVSVTQESVINEDKAVSLQWFEADSIRVFDTDKNSAVLATNNYTDGKGVPEIFFTKKWTAGTPFYAVRPVTENTVCTEEGIEGLEIGSAQEISLINSPGVVPSAGPVTGNRTAYKATLKNTAGAVVFAMTDSTVASVKIESVAGEPVAGVYDIDFAKLDGNEDGFWTLQDGSQSSASIVLTPAEGSKAITLEKTFQKGTYYAKVLPQTYSQGLKLIASFKDGKTTEQILTGEEGGLTVPRSGAVAAVKAMDETLPDEFEVKLDFSGDWPFKEPIYASANQAQSGLGDKYTYEYAYQNGESTFTVDLEFYIYGNKTAYSNHVASAPHQLRMAAKNSRLTLPAIYGRYLKAIKLEVVNTAGKGFELKDFSWNVLATGPGALANKPGELVFPLENGFKPDKNTQYYLGFTAGSTFITAITFVYSI